MKNQARLCGLALAALGGYMLWQSASAVMFQARLGIPAAEALLDFVVLLRIVSAFAAVLAGLAALVGMRLAAWLGGVSVVVLSVLAFAMIGMGADRSLWQDETVHLFLILALTLGIAIAQGRQGVPETA